MIGFTNKRHRFVSKQLEIRNAVLRVIASRVVTVISLAKTWASLWVPGDVVFCRAFSIKLAIFQRFYQRAPAITITKTEMRTLRSMSTTNTLNLNNTFQVVHFFSVSLPSYRTTKGWQIWLEWECVTQTSVQSFDQGNKKIWIPSKQKYLEFEIKEPLQDLKLTAEVKIESDALWCSGKVRNYGLIKRTKL